MGPESAYGTAVTPSLYFRLAGESLKRKPTLQTIRPERRHSAIRQVEARRSTGGGLDVYTSYDSLGYILRWLAAVPESVSGVAGTFQHVFTPSPSFTPPSLTVDVARDIELHRYTGTVLAAGRFSATTQDRHFGMSLQCIGKDEAPAGAIPTPAESVFGEPAFYDPAASDPFLITLYDGSTSWNAFCESVDFNWTWDRKLREPERRTTPTGFTGGGVIAATGKIGTLYDTDSDFLLDAIRSRAPVSLSLTMQGEARREFDLTYPFCQVNGDPPTLRSSGRGNIDFSVDLQSLYSQAEGFGPFQMQLTNAIASYP